MKTKKHSTKKSSKSTRKPSEKVVEIFAAALKHSCPKCGSKAGHRCVRTTSHKGVKRERPHRARLAKMAKLAPKAKVVVKAKVHSIKKSKKAA